MDYTTTTVSPAIMTIYWIVMIVAYVYYAFCLQTIAKKTNTANGWFAWIPLLNIILMIQISGKPMWWIVLFLIPVVNLIFSIIIWMEIAKKVNKPSWWGLLLLVPGVDIIVPGYLAFAK